MPHGRVLLIGANGQLGSDLSRALSPRHEVVPANHDRIEVTDPASVRRVLEEAAPDLVVNTSAYHLVDQCEDEPALAFAVNTAGPSHLAAACDERGIPLAHFSTDYVFDGRKGAPYTEEDCPAPLNLYGISKLGGELAVRAKAPRHWVFRVCGLFGRVGSRVKGYNFVDMMVARAREGKELKVVSDQVLTPTYTLDAAEAAAAVIEAGAPFGLYHLTASGHCSWFDFTREILRRCGLSGTSLTPVPTGFFGEKARRPSWSVLDNAALRAAGIPDLPPWQDGLDRYLREKGHLRG